MSAICNRQRTNGILQPLQDLLDLWAQFGTHDIDIPPTGGYRFGPIDEAQQEELCRNGLSKARTLRETPHGRRCGLDVYPLGFNPHRSFEDASNAGMLQKCRDFVAFVDKYGPPLGLRSGAHFLNFGPLGDIVHVELADWISRSFPGGELPIPAPSASGPDFSLPPPKPTV